jgi:hypothetical protein
MPAPRRFFGHNNESSKKKRKAPLTPEEQDAALAKLKALKRAHAPEVLALCQTIRGALGELEELLTRLDAEAERLQPNFVEAVPGFKLTFEPAYREHNEELDDPQPTLLDFAELMVEVADDASSSYAAADAAADATADASAEDASAEDASAEDASAVVVVDA